MYNAHKTRSLSIFACLLCSSFLSFIIHVDVCATLEQKKKSKWWDNLAELSNRWSRASRRYPPIFTDMAKSCGLAGKRPKKLEKASWWFVSVCRQRPGKGRWLRLLLILIVLVNTWTKPNSKRNVLGLTVCMLELSDRLSQDMLDKCIRL